MIIILQIIFFINVCNFTICFRYTYFVKDSFITYKEIILKTIGVLSILILTLDFINKWLLKFNF